MLRARTGTKNYLNISVTLENTYVVIHTSNTKLTTAITK
jgi:hypothetical protein